MSSTTFVAPRGSLTSRFNDRKISTKIMAIVVVMAALAIIIGAVGTKQIRAVHDQATKLSAHNVAALDALFQVQRDFQAVRARVLLYGAVDAAERVTVAGEIGEFTAAVAKDSAAYSAVSESDDAAIKEFEAGFADMVALFETQMKPLGVDQRLAYGAIIDEKFAPMANSLIDSLQKAKDDEVTRAQARAQEGTDTTSSALRTIVVTTLIGLALALAFAKWVSGLISSPLRRVQASLQAMAERDLTVEANVHSKDEIGVMADALGRAQESIRSVVSMVSDSAQSAAAAADEMAATAQQIAASSAETSAQAGVVAAAAEEVSANVQTVATGSEEMGSSIREIAHNATEAARIAASAVTVAENANATVTKLGDSSTEIGNVVKVITSIAEQTNLLALNATIEAARAGEAGKGFAVVAGEVKELAQETARATEDISRRVAAIQTDTGGAVEAIAQISDVIARISDFQTTIASAVEEQTATTNEMSRNVAEAAAGSNEIAANITGVASAATLTADGVTQTQAAIEELARMSNDLRNQVGSFTV